MAAKAGDTVEVYAVGLGATNPAVAAGQAFQRVAPAVNPVEIFVNGVEVTPTFAGMTGAGLHQVNSVVPAGVGTGDVPLTAGVGGGQTQSGVWISLQ